MGDTDDPSLGLNKILPQDMEFNAGFGLVDQPSFGFERPFTCSDILVTSSGDSDFGNNARLGSVFNQGHIFSSVAANILPPSVLQHQPVEALDGNQGQCSQNSALLFPFSYAQMQEHQFLSPALPPPKRLNLGPNQNQELLLGCQQQQQQLQMLPQRQTMGATATATATKNVTAVNLPIGAFSNYPATFPLVLCFVKQPSPKIVVSLDRGCDRIDVPFSHHMIHALQSYSGLLESLDVVHVNFDALQKIERFFIYPSIEKIVLGSHCSPERLPPWKNLFMQSGFAPLTFSNFTESQADC